MVNKSTVSYYRIEIINIYLYGSTEAFVCNNLFIKHITMRNYLLTISSEDDKMFAEVI